MKIEEIKDMIISSFHEKNNSHAFLLSTNNIDKALNDVLDIVKKVNCLGDGNDSCNVCTTIDSSTNPDVIVVILYPSIEPLSIPQFLIVPLL